MAGGIVEGYYFRVRDGTIFYAKGVVHPPGKVVGYPKYVLIARGDTAGRGVKYVKKDAMDLCLQLVRERYPGLLTYDPFIGAEVPEIPFSFISKVYDPLSAAKSLLSESEEPADDLIEHARSMLADIIDCSGVSTVGISGSLLVGLHTQQSDIDVVVYGFKEGFEVYWCLREALSTQRSRFRKRTREQLLRLYEFRSRETPTPLTEFIRQEERRVLEGAYGDKEYFVRLVLLPEADEGYGAVAYRSLGKLTAKFEVVDASRSIFTPCRYEVKLMEVIEGGVGSLEVGTVGEIYSLRGRFCELAGEGDVVVARGTVEHLIYSNGRSRTRLVLGYPGDYLVNKLRRAHA